jgi:hypothetical protein
MKLENVTALSMMGNSFFTGKQYGGHHWTESQSEAGKTGTQGLCLLLKESPPHHAACLKDSQSCLLL